MLTAAIKALRPRQWTKNGIVFAALVFAEQFRDTRLLGLTIGAFVCMCMLSSAGYLFNDLRDVDNDRAHPKKRNRPIASGALPVGAAWAMIVVLIVVALGAGSWIGPGFAIAAGGYMVSTTVYTLWIKNMVLLDIMFIAGLFILRAVAGAEAIDVPISPWFLITTMFLALFLGFSKRRGELRLLEADATKFRKILGEYSPELLDQLNAVTAAGAILAYAMYTFEAARTQWLMATVPLVVYGIFRYFYLVHKRAQGDAPDATLLKDVGMWATVLLYAVMVVVILVLVP
jgi:4-hydroxybenzoate polyprenyltransferase